MRGKLVAINVYHEPGKQPWVAMHRYGGPSIKDDVIRFHDLTPASLARLKSAVEEREVFTMPDGHGWGLYADSTVDDSGEALREVWDGTL